MGLARKGFSTSQHRRLTVDYSIPVLRKRVASLVTPTLTAPSPRILDIGSGAGTLLDDIAREVPAVSTYACDYTTELMERDGQRVEVVDINRESLPYEDDYFDVVTCTEVVEHLENYRHLLRETWRVTKPGGTVVFSTPNVLNLNSRLRFLWFGFWNLFGPLPVGRDENFSTVGHITPVPFFYLAHALAEAGFNDIGLEVDKYQRSAMPKLVLWWPLIGLFGRFASAKETRRYRTIDDSNAGIMAPMNSLKMLLGRTIVVVARKPNTAAS